LEVPGTARGTQLETPKLRAAGAKEAARRSWLSTLCLLSHSSGIFFGGRRLVETWRWGLRRQKPELLRESLPMGVNMNVFPTPGIPKSLSVDLN
jgi:hypothetical protein